MKKALFIGRFQPFHNAHLSDIKLAMKEGYSVIIAIGSSQESGTKGNPFSYEERAEMISKTLLANNIDNHDILAISDINNDQKWVEHVKSIVKRFDIVYTGNNFTEKLFNEKGIAVRKITLIPHVSATEIRKRILHGNKWKELVPKEVAEFIEKMNGVERIKQINDH
jgi:nicotinamide-nucleotide adenylyltransferase